MQRASNKSSKQAKGQKTPCRDRQTSIIDSWSKQQPLSSSSKEHKALTNSVAYCLARDMLPLSTVDKPGFRAMIYQFNPCYQLPIRKHFTKVAIPALVNDVIPAFNYSRWTLIMDTDSVWYYLQLTLPG